MVDTVVPSLTRLFLVTIVTLEETDRFLVTYTNDYFTFLTILAGCTVSTQQVDIVLGIGNTHRTRFGRHPREGAQRHGGFRLSEALHHLDTRLFFELIKHCRVQGLTSRSTVFQR